MSEAVVGAARGAVVGTARGAVAWGCSWSCGWERRAEFCVELLRVVEFGARRVLPAVCVCGGFRHGQATWDAITCDVCG